MKPNPPPQGRIPNWLTWLASGFCWVRRERLSACSSPARDGKSAAGGSRGGPWWTCCQPSFGPGPPAASPPDSAMELATLSGAPFTGGEQAFRAIKDTLRNKYYRPGLTDDELYRAAVAGMLQPSNRSSRRGTS